MLVTRRPILTSVEENGTFVPSKTRIGSGRIVPRIDESRAIRFCLPRPPGPHRAIPEIDRLANGCSYPSPCSFFLLTSELFLRLSDFTPRGSSFSHDRWRRSRSFSLSLPPLSLSLFLVSSRFVKHLFGTIKATSFHLYGDNAHPPRRRISKRIANFMLFHPVVPSAFLLRPFRLVR